MSRLTLLAHFLKDNVTKYGSKIVIIVNKKATLLTIKYNYQNLLVANAMHIIGTIYNMSGRVVSAYTNSSRRRELYI